MLGRSLLLLLGGWCDVTTVPVGRDGVDNSLGNSSKAQPEDPHSHWLYRCRR